MLSATFIDLFFIPLFYVLVSSLFQKKRHQKITADSPEVVGSAGGR
jgi:hypothetical protein